MPSAGLHHEETDLGTGFMLEERVICPLISPSSTSDRESSTPPRPCL